MTKFIEITENTDIEAMLEVLNTLKITNNGYIFNMEILSKEAKSQLPAMAKAGLVVLTAHKVYTPESYEMHKNAGMVGPIVSHIPTSSFSL